MIAIEVVDLVFAIDSVPAVLAVSHHPFVVYTSNICAILGLRALYFLVAGLLDRLPLSSLCPSRDSRVRGLQDAVREMDQRAGRSLARLHSCHGGAGRECCFTDLTPHQPNLRIAIRWTKPFAFFPSRPSPGHTPFPWEAAFWTLSRRASQRSRAIARKLFVLTSPEIWSLWGQRLHASLAPREPIVLFLPPGERHKRMSQVERLTPR